MLTFLLALNGGARPTVNQLLQHPFFADQNYLDIMDKTAPDNKLPQETKGHLPFEGSALPKEVLAPSEKTPSETNAVPSDDGILPPVQSNVSVESVVSEFDDQPGFGAPASAKILPDVTTLTQESTLPVETTLPGETTLADTLPLSANAAPTETCVTDETLLVEEALPEEYAVAPKKQVLKEQVAVNSQDKVADEAMCMNEESQNEVKQHKGFALSTRYFKPSRS